MFETYYPRRPRMMFTPEAVYLSRRELAARLTFWFCCGMGAGLTLAVVILT